jgi:hypothetical protein
LVNWTRFISKPITRAKNRTSVVLPMPGTSSIKMWPWQSTAVNANKVSSPLPGMTSSARV